MCICYWQNRTLIGFHLLQNMNCKVLRRKPVFPASATGHSLFSLYFSVTCRFNLQCSSQCSHGMRTKKLFLESAYVGSQPNSTAIQLWNSFWTVFFIVKVAGTGFDGLQDLYYFCFLWFWFLPSIFQFLWNSPQKVVSNSSKYFLWFELKKTKYNPGLEFFFVISLSMFWAHY